MQWSQSFDALNGEFTEPPAKLVNGLVLVLVTTTGTLTLEPVRFCCRPDVLAFEGTESVRSATRES